MLSLQYIYIYICYLFILIIKAILYFRFIQIAEESSRPTFQSIESIVGAVGSVAMMLENTFMAMTSSFRAILGLIKIQYLMIFISIGF